MAGSKENLGAAIAGESQANQRYLASAKAAEAEGRKMIAKLFRAAAAAETVHAQNHLDALKAIGTTAANLAAARAGEQDEFEKMYPEFIETAKAEGNEDAEKTFDLAMQVERIHHALYTKAAESLQAGKDLPYDHIFVCRGCGNTLTGAAPQKCPVCGAPKSWFMWIE
jgi:rubrerythrin